MREEFAGSNASIVMILTLSMLFPRYLKIHYSTSARKCKVIGRDENRTSYGMMTMAFYATFSITRSHGVYFRPKQF